MKKPSEIIPFFKKSIEKSSQRGEKKTTGNHAPSRSLYFRFIYFRSRGQWRGQKIKNVQNPIYLIVIRLVNKQDSKESKIARKATFKTQNIFKIQNISRTQNASKAQNISYTQSIFKTQNTSNVLHMCFDKFLF